jgi:hypothetical protein
MNFPTFRQLYLPLAGVSLLLVAWRPAGFRRLASWVAGGLVLALILLYQTMGPALARASDRAAHEVAGSALSSMLAGADARAPIVQAGQSRCGYSLDYDADGREVWKLMPPTLGGGVPLLRVLDERTVEVRAPVGDGLALATSVPVEARPRRARVVPALLTAGWQRLGIATAHAPERKGELVIGFRLTFDRPLAAHMFVTVAGCVELRRWAPDTSSRAQPPLEAECDQDDSFSPVPFSCVSPSRGTRWSTLSCCRPRTLRCSICAARTSPTRRGSRWC